MRLQRVVTIAASSLFLTMIHGGNEAIRLEAQDAKPTAKRYIDVHEHLWGRANPMKGGGPGGGGRPGQGGKPGAGGRPPGGGPGGGGGRPPADWEAAAKNLLDHMDRYGVDRALLMPPPRTDQNLDPEEFEGLKSVVASHPDRFSLAAGGDVLNPLIHKHAPSDVTEAVKKRFEAEAERLLKDGVRCFGEMAALHLSMNEKHVSEESPPDHPLFLLLADIAAKHDIPIDLHMEAVPKDMPTPVPTGSGNPETLHANIEAFERLLSHNRGARIVWQHIGWDNTGQMTIDLLKRLLTAHPNLYMAIRVEEREQAIGGGLMKNRIVDREWKVKKEWIDLFTAFPDRFCVGSDEFFGQPGDPQKAPQSFEETWRALEQLPAELVGKMGRENAVRIYGLK